MRQCAKHAAILANGEAFSNHHDLLSADLADALIVASPNHTHRDVLIDVMTTDLPIMVEKPLCSTVEDAQHIKTLAQSRTAPVWVAMEYRYMPAIARLIEEVDDGRVGKLRMLAIREHRFPFLKKSAIGIAFPEPPAVPWSKSAATSLI